MLAEFITKLEGLTKKANGVEVVPVSQIRDKILIRKGDAFEWEDIPPPPRASKYHGLDDFVAAVMDKDICPDPEVYHDGVGLHAWPNRAERREQIHLIGETSDRWTKMSRLVNDTVFDTRALIKFLRFDLNGTGVETLIPLIRKVDFTRKSDGKNQIEHGKESLGKSVEMAVQQAETIPESFRVEVARFSNPQLRTIKATITIGIYIDVSSDSFVLRALGDEIKNAEEFIQSEINTRLHAVLKDVPIFQGTP
jgi:hypothetical protein